MSDSNINSNTNIQVPYRRRIPSSPLKRFIRPFLFLVGLGFFLVMAYRSWNEILSVLLTLDTTLFSFSILLGIVYNVLFSLLFHILLKKYGINISYSKAGHMFFYGQIAKYIPGRFWSIFYHSSFLKRRGTTSAMLFTNLDLTAISILQSVVVALCLIMFFKSVWLASLAFAFGITVFWFLNKFCLISRLVKPVLGRLKVPPESIVTCAPCPKSRQVLIIGVFAWVTYLASGFLLLESAFDLPIEQTAIYIAYSAIAWALGVISFVVPAGIGIREAAFVFLAQHSAPGAAVQMNTLISIAVVYRLWHILLEIGGLGIGFILSRFTQRGK